MIFFFYLKLILGRREKISRYVDERTTRKIKRKKPGFRGTFLFI
jgi:hypothetical protein